MSLRPLRVVILFHDADRDVLVRLETHLRSAFRDGLALLWHRDKALPGQDENIEIEMCLARAQLVLLLVSADFNASWDYGCRLPMNNLRLLNYEVVPVVVPILAKPCISTGMPFGTYRPIPTDGLPLVADRGDLQDARVHLAATEILDVVKYLREKFEHVTGEPADEELYRLLIESERERHRVEQALIGLMYEGPLQRPIAAHGARKDDSAIASLRTRNGESNPTATSPDTGSAPQILQTHAPGVDIAVSHLRRVLAQLYGPQVNSLPPEEVIMHATSWIKTEGFQHGISGQLSSCPNCGFVSPLGILR